MAHIKKNEFSIVQKFSMQTYAFALLLVAALSTSAFLVVHLVINEHKSRAEVINVSGRQRMLSQRIALLLEQLNMTKTHPHGDDIFVISSTIDLFEKSHHELSVGSEALGEPIPEVTAVYFDADHPLDTEVQNYIANARYLVDENNFRDPNYANVLKQVRSAAKDQLLSGLDNIVHINQKSSDEQVQYLSTVEALILTVTLILLALEALFIFRPLILRTVKLLKDSADLAANTHALTQRIDHCLANSSTQKEVIQSVLKAVVEQLKWKSAIYWKTSIDGTVLEYSDHFTVNIPRIKTFAEKSKAFTYPKGSGLPGRVWESRTSAWIDNIPAESNFPRTDIAKESGLKKFFNIPVEFGGTFYGCLEIATDQDGSDPRTIEFFSELGGRIAQRLQFLQDKVRTDRHNRLLQGILDGYPEPIGVRDNEGRYLIANQAMAEAFDVTVDQLIGRSLRGIVTDEAAELSESEDQAIFATAQSTTIERSLPNQGKRRHYLIHRFPIFDMDGSVGSVCTITTNISSQKILRAEIEMSRLHLLEEKQKADSLLLALNHSAIVAVTDKQGKIKDVNEMFCEVSGYSRSELLGKDHRILNSKVHPKSFFKEMWSTITSGKTWHGEIVNRKKNGDLYWLSSTIVPQKDVQGNVQEYIAIRFDITQQKEMENKMVNTANSVPSLIANWDKNLRLQFANQAYYDWFGLQPDQLRAITLREALGEEIFAKNKPYLEAALAGTTQHFDREMARKSDGKVRRVSVDYIPDMMKGEVRGILIHVNDVTDMKLAEERAKNGEERALKAVAELQQTEEELRQTNDYLESRVQERTQELQSVIKHVVESKKVVDSIISNTAVILFSVNKDGILTLSNGNGLAAIGSSTAERVGRSVFEVHKNNSGVIDSINRALKGEKVNGRSRISGIWHQVFYDPVFDSNGKPNGLTGLAFNIHEQVLSQTALTQTQERLTAILKHVPFSFWAVDANRKFIFREGIGVSATGLNSDQMIGRSIDEVYGPFPHVLEAMNRAFMGESFEVLTEIGPRWYNVAFAPTLDDEGKVSGISGITFDITDRRRIEIEKSEFEVNARSAEEASRLKSDFLANMSHEIRTPLNGILGMTDLLLETDLQEIQRRYASIVQESGRSLLGIINDILDFSKIEAGKMTLEMIQFSPLNAVESQAALYSAKAKEKGLSLMTFVDPQVPAYVRGDQGRLGQVLGNLITNAIKFTQSGAVVVRAELGAKSKKSDKNISLRFSIEDTGIGMSKAEQAKLFQPFTQADGSTARKFGGTGLGLSICKRIVEMMNGEIHLESTPGKGSTFSFTVRFEREEQSKTLADSVSVNTENLPVLIVDDDPPAGEIVASYLKAWKMVPVHVSNAADALTALRREATAGRPFALAIIDKRMPEMDGIELAKKIKAESALKNTPMILMSAYTRAENTPDEKALFSTALSKPLRQSEMYNSIVNAVHGQRATERVKVDSTKHTEHAVLKSAKILIAEDNQVNQLLIVTQIESMGATALAVGNGIEVIEAYKKGHFDLILMDCQMPEMDGFEATRAIRKLEQSTGKHISIVALTANAMSDDKKMCLEAGMDDHLSKPVKKDTLLKMIARWLPVDRKKVS